jgi:hypothetical protein
VLIVPERNSHRTRTNLAVAEGYLIVAKAGIQTPDKHNSFVHYIFHIAARAAAPVETGKGATALGCSVDYFLRYVARHALSERVYLQALASPRTPYVYYTATMQSNYFCGL